MSDTRGPSATRVSLMGSLLVVMLHELLGHGSHLFQSRRPVDLQTLLVEGSMIPLHRRILVWSLRRAHVWLDAYTEQEAAQARSGNRASKCFQPTGDREELVSLAGRPYCRRKWTTARDQLFQHESPDGPGH